MYRFHFVIVFTLALNVLAHEYEEQNTENPLIKCANEEFLSKIGFSKPKEKLELVVVNTKHGFIVGSRMESDGERDYFYAFRGIPYALPPVGDLRFAPPVQYSNTKRFIDATRDGNICMQPTANKSRVIGSEDCLFVNVYVPKVHPIHSLPVIVNIHGGGFLVGSADYEEGGPDFLLDYDVIYVSFNYRLGFLGFFSTEDMVAPGNNGLKDQLLALRWIKENIYAFGGNPDEVTIMGNHAGGASVSLLLQSPSARGLFKRSIIISGNSLSAWSIVKSPRNIALGVGKILGINANCSQDLINGLRTFTAQDVVIASNQCSFLWESPYKLVYIPSREPNHSNAIFCDSSYKVLSEGQLNAEAILIGHNANDGLVQELAFDPDKYSNADCIVSSSMNIKNPAIKRNVAKSILKRFFPNGTVTLEGHIKYHTEEMFSRSTTKFVELICNRYKVYQYKFSYISESGDPIPRILEGLNHTENLKYILKPCNEEKLSKNDALTRRRCCKLIVNFAIYGNPTPIKQDIFNNVQWKLASDSKNIFYLDFHESFEMKTSKNEEDYVYWNKLFAAYGVPPYDTF